MSTAILLPGSASTSAFVRRAFAPILTGVDISDWTPSGGDASAIAEQLRQFTATRAGESIIVIGVSIGAHAAALWASAQPRIDARLLLALPAWTGAAAEVAAMTALAAQRIADHGLDRELRSLTEQFPGDWVAEELVRAWGSAEPDALVATLRATASSAAPTLQQLGNIVLPTLVLGLLDDPLHPWSVAQEWHRAIPDAELVSVSRRAPQSDLAALGNAAAGSVWAGAGLRHQP